MPLLLRLDEGIHDGMQVLGDCSLIRGWRGNFSHERIQVTTLLVARSFHPSVVKCPREKWTLGSFFPVLRCLLNQQMKIERSMRFLQPGEGSPVGDAQALD
jgi:hypothetical protein